MDKRIFLSCELVCHQMELYALNDYYKNRKKELKHLIKEKKKKIKSIGSEKC